MSNLEFVDDDDDFQTILAEQRREFMAAQSLESDFDLAFHLQLQEAMTASLSLHPSNSNSPPPPPPPPVTIPTEDVPNITSLQSEELSKLEQETRDRKHCIDEFERAKEDLHRRIHDQKFARHILQIPEDDWLENGDIYERPFGEGSSRSVHDGVDEIFRVYFKGLVSEESVKGSTAVLAGIGVAICDSSDTVIFEIRKPLVGNGTSRQGAEVKALIEGLNAALALDLKRLACFVDYFPIFQYVKRKWTPKSLKIATLVSQVFNLQKKFSYCHVTLVARNDIKFAFKLAREAIVSQITGPAESISGKILKESCTICLEEADVGRIFSVDGCLHRYCFSCMKQHVEVKLLHGMLPKCPHEGCKSELNIDSCRNFLTPKLIEIMGQRLKEASIPAIEKIYCPYPRCSALMSKGDLQNPGTYQNTSGQFGARRCTKCSRIFCIQCKVPWHNNMTCIQYKRLNPYPREEDAKLKSLATRNLWRQCVKCNHMIELAEGCYHMTCRCGYEFCYTCGAEWKNKKASCSCPLWDEENIIDEEDSEDDEDDFNDDWDEEYDESDSDDYF